MVTNFDTILRTMNLYSNISVNKDFRDTLYRIYQRLLQITNGKIEMTSSNRNNKLSVKFVLLDGYRREWFDICNYIYDEMITTLDNDVFDMIPRRNSVEVISRDV